MIDNANIDFRLFTEQLMKFYGFKSRATFLAKEKSGQILKRKKFPDGKLGNMHSEVTAWAALAEEVV